MSYIDEVPIIQGEELPLLFGCPSCGKTLDLEMGRTESRLNCECGRGWKTKHNIPTDMKLFINGFLRYAFWEIN